MRHPRRRRWLAPEPVSFGNVLVPMLEYRAKGTLMPAYQQGDCVKVEFKDERRGESEWLWVLVDHCDEGRRVVFGRLDNQPIVNTDLKLGQELAISYDLIRDVGKQRPTQ